MINRILIRIKVVQMLYSYLLSQSEFQIDKAPESASRDIRYAYSAYIDLLLLIIELSGFSVDAECAAKLNIPAKLQANRVGKALAADDAIRSVILRGANKVKLLDPVINNIIAKIQASAVFADYSKKRSTELADDVVLWITIMESIIAKDTAVADAMRKDPDFTNVGFNKAIEKVCNTLRSYNESRQLFVKARKDLETSLDKAYELYLWLLKLTIELTHEQAERLENAKNKYIVTSEDRNPNTRLIDNAFVQYLKDDEQFNALLDDYKLSASNAHPLLLRNLLDKILASDIYQEYISKTVSDLAGDADFWREVMAKIILPSDELAEDLEDRSVYWNDDLEIMGTFAIKTIRKIATSNGKHIDILPKYKDDEDSKFGPELFLDAVKNHELYRSYIDQFIDNAHWDPERMAYMDFVIMVIAISEIINYPKIPIPVTVNEYVEIANHYSTEKSGNFINGILCSVINFLNEKGIINKK